MGRRVADDGQELRDRVEAAQLAADQRRLDAAYRERFGPHAHAPRVHPVQETVERATLPIDPAPADSSTPAPQEGSS